MSAVAVAEAHGFRLYHSDVSLEDFNHSDPSATDEERDAQVQHILLHLGEIQLYEADDKVVEPGSDDGGEGKESVEQQSVSTQVGDDGYSSVDDPDESELAEFDPRNPERARRMRESMPAARYSTGLDVSVPEADKFVGFKHPPGSAGGIGGKAPLAVRVLASAAAKISKALDMKEFKIRMDDLHERQTARGIQAGLHVHRNVPYKISEDSAGETGAKWKHRLDVYLPGGPRKQCPLVIHFHGGGWMRGDRQAEFQGGPAISRAYAISGSVCFTPSYRLGSPIYIEDAADAVKWVLKNAHKYGADPSLGIYLSGHSAGGNIASLLAISGEYLPKALQEFNSFVAGACLLAGVYTALNPLGGRMSRVKNLAYDAQFRSPVFGNDLGTLARHSSTALLRLAVGEKTPFPKNSCSLSSIARHFLKGSDENESFDLSVGDLITTGPEGMSWSSLPPPPCLVLNAEIDVGLEADGARLMGLLKRRRKDFAGNAVEAVSSVDKYQVIEGTNHTTLAWSKEAFQLCTEWVTRLHDQNLQNSAGL